MEDCIFCKIIKGEIPSYGILENDKLYVFLDINPNSNGHMLVVPKEHVENVLDVKSDFITEALEIIREKLYPLLKAQLNIDGLTITQNNFLGQDVKHYHIHLIPKYSKDNKFYEKRDVKEIYDILNNYGK